MQNKELYKRKQDAHLNVKSTPVEAQLLSVDYHTPSTAANMALM